MAHEVATALGRFHSGRRTGGAAWCLLMVGLTACHDADSPTLDDASSSARTDEAGVDAGAVDAASAPSDADATVNRDSAVPTPAADAMPLDAQLDAASPSAVADGSLDSAVADGSLDSAIADAMTDSAVVDAMQPGKDAQVAPDGQVPGPVKPSVKQLVLGRAHGCSLDPAISGLICWGDNRHGQATVPSLDSPTFVAAGGDVTCAIDGARVRCWGDDAHGQLAVPAGLGRATQLAVGDAHACALTAAGAVRCWGDDAFGQLGVPALRDVKALGAGVRHSCALAQGGVTCWGDDAQGQSHAPTLVSPVQLAVGGFHSCALAQGGVTCWGGSAALRAAVPTLSSPTLIAAGRSHSCALDSSGARCWGDPAAGGLAPRELTNVKQLAVGGAEGFAHACARHQQGIACWGDNRLGQTAYDGRPLHVLYRAESSIAAPPAAVWSVLMDLKNYGLWNPFTTAMKSTLKVGDPMVMTVKMSALVTLEQTEHIRVLDGRKACWGIETTTPESNSGERCQWLEPLPDGGTRYVTEDLIEGTLNPVAIGLFGENTRVGFEGVARELKVRVEALQKP
jgi:Regulator of chromosome condensation (RCC1) repeat